jgi:hypothetical protein
VANRDKVSKCGPICRLIPISVRNKALSSLDFCPFSFFLAEFSRMSGAARQFQIMKLGLGIAFTVGAAYSAYKYLRMNKELVREDAA